MACAPTPMASPNPVASPKPTKAAELSLLFDGECPLCVKEVKFLRSRAASQNTPDAIEFVDIAAPDYSPEQHAGIGYEEAMGRIHAVTPDGVVTGVEVFRRAYEAVGLGWVYAISKVPGISAVAEAVYNVWAGRRLALTGRASLEELVRLRRASGKNTCR